MLLLGQASSLPTASIDSSCQNGLPRCHSHQSEGLGGAAAEQLRSESREREGECHSRLLEKLGEPGRQPAPLEPESILPRMVADHDEVRPLMAQSGFYGWGDAFREAFGLVRPEYRD